MIISSLILIVAFPSNTANHNKDDDGNDDDYDDIPRRHKLSLLLVSFISMDLMNPDTNCDNKLKSP